MKVVSKPYERHLLAVIVLYLLGLAVYSNTFTSPFVFDDVPNILENTAIQLTELSFDGLHKAAFESVSPNRPVAFISFAFNYWAGGFDVRGYHLVNLFVHVCNGVLVYALVLMLLGRSQRDAPAASRANVRMAALAAAAVFVVHPIQTQAVTYIVQRMTSLGTFFFLLSLLCFVTVRLELTRRRVLLWTVCVISGLLAIGTKEIAATLPLAIVLIHWCFFRDCSWAWLAKNIRHVLMALLAFIALGLLYLGTDPLLAIDELYSTRKFSLVERLLTEMRVLFFYLGLVACPTPQRLNLLHDFALSRGFLEPFTTLLSALGLVAAVAVALKSVGRRPIVVFCILWFLLTSVIESSVVGLELVYEHRVYLPLFGLCFGFAALVLWFARRTLVVWVCVVGVVLYLSAGTYLRNAHWADATTLWVDVVSKSPNSARSHNNLGRALLRSGANRQASMEFNKALFLEPDYAEAHNNLGVMFADRRQFEVAMGYFERALELEPGSAQTLHNIGLALAEMGRSQDAMERLRQAIWLDPSYAKPHIALAALLARGGDNAHACKHLREALRTVAPGKLREALAYCD